MLDVDGAAVVVGKLESCHLEAVCSVILDYQADDLFPVEQIPHFFMSNNEGLDGFILTYRDAPRACDNSMCHVIASSPF